VSGTAGHGFSRDNKPTRINPALTADVHLRDSIVFLGEREGANPRHGKCWPGAVPLQTRIFVQNGRKKPLSRLFPAKSHEVAHKDINWRKNATSRHYVAYKNGPRSSTRNAHVAPNFEARLDSRHRKLNNLKRIFR